MPVPRWWLRRRGASWRALTESIPPGLAEPLPDGFRVPRMALLGVLMVAEPAYPAASVPGSGFSRQVGLLREGDGLRKGVEGGRPEMARLFASCESRCGLPRRGFGRSSVGPLCHLWSSLPLIVVVDGAAFVVAGLDNYL